MLKFSPKKNSKEENFVKKILNLQDYFIKSNENVKKQLSI
jgi:hypothetical protein